MPREFTRLTYTDSVKAAQEAYGTRAKAAKLESFEFDDLHLGESERAFIAARDSFYMATVNDQGWPYVQFRGGPAGFLRVLDSQTIGYADFRGNQQLISTGNLSHDGRVSLILLDYPRRQRLKILAEAKIYSAEERPDLIEALEDPTYRARVQRAVVMTIKGFDWNCPQHITPRFTQAEIEAGFAS
ncbi:MAG: pyridoxamine 5'-phosphate oxidase family protein [Planctomycetes bacterium]|nr:pyridoxamine 5'-phosphate oxidase family protein [Planctomycetota bacterium]